MVNHSMSSLLKQIIAVYPEYEEEIIEIFHKDETFVELVEDYLFCKNKLKCHLANTNDYRDALKELEDEILEQIDVQQQKMKYKKAAK